MENFSNRLKTERERLGLTQAKFAEACGVGKTAQYTYERGDRLPALEYIDAAGALGVDISYLLRGERTGAEAAKAHGFLNILIKIQNLLGLKSGEIERLNKEILNEIEVSVWHNKTQSAKPLPPSVLDVDVRQWLKTATTPDACMDLGLFTSVLAEVEANLGSTGTTLLPTKKAEAVMMLYRSFRPTGQIDQLLVSDVVKLASEA